MKVIKRDVSFSRAVEGTVSPQFFLEKVVPASEIPKQKQKNLLIFLSTGVFSSTPEAEL